MGIVRSTKSGSSAFPITRTVRLCLCLRGGLLQKLSPAQ